MSEFMAVEDIKDFKSLPHASLYCSRLIAKQGDMIAIEIISSKRLDEQHNYNLELISVCGDTIWSSEVARDVNLFELYIEEMLDKGQYQLRLRVGNWILDSLPFEITDEDEALLEELFSRGLDLSLRVTEAIEAKNYKLAIQLNEEASDYFVQANMMDIAAKSWRDLGEDFIVAEHYDNALMTLNNAVYFYERLGDEIGKNSAMELYQIAKSKFDYSMNIQRDEFISALSHKGMGLPLAAESRTGSAFPHQISNGEEIIKRPVINDFVYPWLTEGEIPPLPFERDKINIIGQGISDPVFDYSIIPLTHTESRWMAYIIRADINDMKAITPEPIEIQDDVIEFWYVIHKNTMLGIFLEMGVTFSATVDAGDGKIHKAGYYPYMYLSNDSPIFAGKEPFGFPKKAAYIAGFEHGTNNNYFNHLLEHRGYILHTAHGRYSDKPLYLRPSFYGRKDWGRMNFGIKTMSEDEKMRVHEVTYLESELPNDFGGGHRFQLNPQSIRTAQGGDIRSWETIQTPFDFMGGQVPVKEIVGLISFTFNLLVPPPKVVWRKVYKSEDEGVIEYTSPSEYVLRGREYI